MNFCYGPLNHCVYAGSDVVDIAFFVKTVFYDLIGLEEVLEFIGKLLILVSKNVYVLIEGFDLLGKLV
jgi:hypothetical protein